ncbi:hypothetical protein Q4519_21110 [Motilimonas sp. 1_MG-2023]|uniref:hypothetical protein n=1 Tax=Motilimonas sp. 1_MG-2023 TaxID=3062672 RepID=UPI0026E206B2|nr:hypothetical protein [Motilimonas sp. 1_MG-2023]MDO6528172.1 hypothetical protein [Motilimonas sp. 1_MG-2023]
MESKFDKLLAFSVALIHFFAFSGLIYRAQIYEHIPVSSGDPYGLGDIIDLLFVFIVVVIWCCAFISAVAVTLLNFKTNWLASLKLLLYASVGLIGYLYVKDSSLLF